MAKTAAKQTIFSDQNTRCIFYDQ